MDGVSGASAVASLVILGAKLAIQVQSFLGKVKNAQDDVKNISSDLESIVSVLGRLEGALINSQHRRIFQSMNGHNDFARVIDSLMAIFTTLELLMKKYDKVSQSRVTRAKWAWAGLDEASRLGRTLGTHKTTLILTLQLTNTLALSAIGAGEDFSNLEGGQPGAQQIVFKMRNLLAQTSQRSIYRDNRAFSKADAVCRWLQQATSVAGSTIAPEDAAELFQERLTIDSSTRPPSTRSWNMISALKNTGRTENNIKLDDASAPNVSIEETASAARPRGLSRRDRSIYSKQTMDLKSWWQTFKNNMKEDTFELQNLGSQSQKNEGSHLVPIEDSKYGRRGSSEGQSTDVWTVDELSRFTSSSVRSTGETHALSPASEDGRANNLGNGEASIETSRPTSGTLKQQEIAQSPEDSGGADTVVGLALVSSEPNNTPQLSNKEPQGGSEAMYKLALQRAERAFGRDNSMTISIVADMSLFYQGRGMIENADEMAQRAFTSYATLDKPTHEVAMARVIRKLGLIRYHQGRWAEALELTTTANAAFRLHEQIDLAIECATLLGFTHKAMGNHTAAEEIWSSTLQEATEKHANNIWVSTCAKQLGYLNEKQGKLHEAELYYNRAFEGMVALEGYEGLNTIQSLYDLANILKQQKRHEEALAKYQQALEGYKKVRGPLHEDTLEIYQNIGYMCQLLEKFDEAQIMYEKAVEGSKSAFGIAHKTTIRSLETIAWLYYFQDKCDDASKLFMEAITAYDEIEPFHDSARWELHNSLDGLAQTLTKQRKLNAAKVICEYLLDLCKNVKGLEDIATGEAFHSLGAVCFYLEQPMEAADNYQQALEIYRRERQKNY